MDAIKIWICQRKRISFICIQSFKVLAFMPRSTSHIRCKIKYLLEPKVALTCECHGYSTQHQKGQKKMNEQLSLRWIDVFQFDAFNFLDSLGILGIFHENNLDGYINLIWTRYLAQIWESPKCLMIITSYSFTQNIDPP